MVSLLRDAFNDHSSRVAVETVDQILTYAELEGRVEETAQCLARHGVRSGHKIAILLNSRVEILHAVLSVLMLQGIFAPIATDLPLPRLARVLDDLRPDFIFFDLSTEQTVANALINGEAQKCADRVEISHNIGLFALQNEGGSARLPNLTQGKTPCYIYYTSGSTGNPKGIVGAVESLAHFISWEISTLDIGPDNKISQFTIPSFDAYLRDTLVPLCAGGTVCIPDGQVASLVPEALVRWIDRVGISVIHCVPSVFKLIAEENLHENLFKSLRYVLMAGEAPNPIHIQKWFQLLGDRIKLVNLYGSTETTMVKFWHTIDRVDLNRGFIPIGRPMQGAKAIIVDEHGEPCVPGTVGEILIRSPYLSLGYYNDPDLTSKVFIANPYNNDPHDIVYKTGDYARMGADKTIQLLGRKDKQTKINGIRIDLGDIEWELSNHPSVEDCIVLSVENERRENHLVGFILSMQGPQDCEDAIIDWLSIRVPQYAVPRSICILERWPLLPNGKVDRNALSTVGRSLPPVSHEYDPPANDIEETLAEIWSALLLVERIGRRDNFFALGGHSLSMMQLVSRIQEQFGIELQLTEVFQLRTLSELADRVAQMQKTQERASKTTLLIKQVQDHHGPEIDVSTLTDEQVNEYLKHLL